ncbi:BQ5605_C014g07668 [Microbotryum silenes-dioicae]|uniref:BQ5605_C014g07668 protein n=1 Tax=Microbotryum silenes-dioicae TaxID=796604 RepID=A0A2X0LUI7_9BASI|nr:BQ5605_C014g07668 [Microbotryum silenes-dioicae]
MSRPDSLHDTLNDRDAREYHSRVGGQIDATTEGLEAAAGVDGPAITGQELDTSPQATATEDKLAPTAVDESTILTGKKLAIVFVSMLLSIFLIALDQTILATALPRIASDFKAFNLQGWVSSAFILTRTLALFGSCCYSLTKANFYSCLTETGFLLPSGQLLRVWPASELRFFLLLLPSCFYLRESVDAEKNTDLSNICHNPKEHCLLIAIVLFEVGSALCAGAPNVYALIVGRAISGVGAAGIFTSMLQILAQVTRLEDRPRLFGFFGAVFGLSSVIGPLMGGALTDSSTYGWRFCFVLNIPVGAVTFTAVTFMLKASPPLGAKPDETTMKARIRNTGRMDWVGATLLFAAITCLVLALQWGGNTKPWNSGSVIACLVVAVVLGAASILWQSWLGDRAMVPGKVFKSLSIFAICGYSFTTRFALLIFTYYLPLFYQAGRDHTATKSGIDILPFMLGVVISVILGGQIVARIGRYWPFLVIGPVFMSIGSGLMYTISVSTPSPTLIGFQILAGIGVGLSMQNSLLAMQAEFKDNPKLVAQATSMASFSQFLGGTIGLAVGQAAFSSRLSANLRQYAPTAPASVIERSPLAIYTAIEASIRPDVIKAYVKALDIVFILGVPFGVLALLLSLLIKNIDIRAPKAHAKPKDEEEGAATAHAETASSPEKIAQKVDTVSDDGQHAGADSKKRLSSEA